MERLLILNPGSTSTKLAVFEGEEPLFENAGIEVDCPAESNICIKAWRLMHERYGVQAVRITLDKRTPFGAGLGGGSADGTAVICALNEIFALGLSGEELVSLAAELGSDTAFFRSQHSAALHRPRRDYGADRALVARSVADACQA